MRWRPRIPVPDFCEALQKGGRPGVDVETAVRDAIVTGDLPAPEATHPWDAFLKARAAAIDWMTAEGDDDEKIRAALSMDLDQVRLIRDRDRTTL